MPFKECRLQLSDIDLDNVTFQITTETALRTLIDSIRAIDLINPPILYLEKSGYIVISGFRRIAAYQELNRRHIKANVMAPGTTLLVCAKMAIADNALQRRLNLVETSRALNLLSASFKDLKGMGKTAEMIGLPGNPELMAKIMTISKLPNTIQNGVLNNRVSMKVAIELGG